MLDHYSLRFFSYHSWYYYDLFSIQTRWKYLRIIMFLTSFGSIYHAKVFYLGKLAHGINMLWNGVDSNEDSCIQRFSLWHTSPNIKIATGITILISTCRFFGIVIDVGYLNHAIHLYTNPTLAQTTCHADFHLVSFADLSGKWKSCIIWCPYKMVVTFIQEVLWLNFQIFNCSITFRNYWGIYEQLLNNRPLISCPF